MPRIQHVVWQLAAWRWWVPLWIGRQPVALLKLEQWLSRAPAGCAQPCRAWATRAHLLGGVGRWPEAAIQLARLVLAQPQQAAHHFNHGYALQQTQRWSEAEHAFRTAVRLSPRLDVAWFGLGDVLWHQGQWAEAEEAWIRQTALQPFCPDGWVRLVRLYVQQGRVGHAQASLDRLKAFDPRSAMALESLLGNALVWVSVA